MKISIRLVLPYLFITHLPAEEAIDPERAANTIILTESGVKNLRIELIEAEERTFNETVFAIGRIEDVPGRGYAISSRIPGLSLIHI